MKKRILALALAGTTAFSVFGSALSANAAYWWETPDSAHVASTNDMYKPYEPVAETISASYTSAYQNLKYIEVKDAYIQIAEKEEISYVFADSDVGLADATEVKSNGDGFWVDTATGTLYVRPATNDEENFATYFPDGLETVKFNGKDYLLNKTTVVTGFIDGTDNKEKLNGLYVSKVTETKPTYELLTGKDAEGLDNLTVLKGTYYVKSADDTTLYCLEEVPSETELLKLAGYTVKETIASELYDSVDATFNMQIEPDDEYAWNEWTFNKSTSSDTTIYPWTTKTTYKQLTDGTYTSTIAVDEAVEDPTVYLFDFLPTNRVVVTSDQVATAYNNCVSATAAYDAVAADKDATTEQIAAAETAMNTAREALAKLIGTTAWVAETGDGTDYGIRAEVVDQYEDFLSELVLLQRYRDYFVDKEEFLSEYEDRYVSGYYYNPFTGLASELEWTTDLYNLDDLLEDIYDSSLPSTTGRYAYNYLNMNTSELMYLMQQYDKYVGYIEKEEVSNDEWGDLLVSILENVAEDDFKKAADYKTFSRKAEDAIDAYNYAETSSMIKTAEEKMYKLIVSNYTKSSGAADAQDELGATVDSLFFNAKSAPVEYQTNGMTTGNAALTNFAYIAAVTTNLKDLYGEITLTQSTLTTTGYFSLYPSADYKQTGNTAAQFPGNNANSDTYGVDVTDEYEWFLNVYELARAVNNISDAKSVNGIVSAVNDALTAAVEDLSVTVSAAGSTTAALEEKIADCEDDLDFYVTGNGVNEEDFNETYYDAYTKALEIAASAEGETQVALARRMVAVAADALTYQGTQETVTKNMIGEVEDAIDAGETALEAIKNSDDYNAAQVTALNKAIAQAQDIVDIYNGTYSSSYNKVNKANRSGVGDKDGIVISDTTGAIDAIDAAINYSEVKLGWTETEDGKWQYGYEKEDGTLAYVESGWYRVGNSWFYFENSTAVESDWRQIDGKWYYLNPSCAAAYGWTKVDGNWYYFNQDNSMKTGWLKSAGHWYYLVPSGKMATGWAQVDGKWYYFSKTENAIGQMLANTTTPDGCKVDENGVWVK